MNSVHVAPSLPLELLFRVLDEVVAEGCPTFGVGLKDVELCPCSVADARLALPICTLVSQAFHDYLLPVMFFRTTISSYERLKEFHSFLSTNPRIRPHIHSLALNEEDHETDSIWVIDQNLACILAVLELLGPTLSELSFDCQFESLRPFGEDSNLARRLVDFLMGSSLQSFRLRGVFPPADMFRHLPPNLQHLDLERCRLDTDHEWAPVPAHHISAPLSIKTMHVSFSSSLMASMLEELATFGQPPLPNLTHLVVSTSLMDIWAWPLDDLFRFAPNLTSMRVHNRQRAFLSYPSLSTRAHTRPR
jgi:hypothetical protein